jgi:dihydrofolate reductase
MRNLVYSMMVSLDGFVETPDRKLDWVIVDEELHRFANDQAREKGAFIYGRRLYELMADYWPTADEDPSAPEYIVEFARIWKDKPKIVVSRTLESVGWNSRLIRDDIAEEIARLKQQPGNDLAIGGANLASSVIPLDLIDEYALFVHPVVLGAGTPFFPPMEKRLDLTLVETKKFGSGAVYLRYRRAGQRGAR